MAYEIKTVEQVVDQGVDFSLSIVEQRIVDFIFLKVPIPFWSKILVFLVHYIFKNFAYPALDDLQGDGFLLIRKAERKKELKIYKEAPDEDFDESVDDFLHVPGH